MKRSWEYCIYCWWIVRCFPVQQSHSQKRFSTLELIGILVQYVTVTVRVKVIRHLYSKFGYNNHSPASREYNSTCRQAPQASANFGCHLGNRTQFASNWIIWIGYSNFWIDYNIRYPGNYRSNQWSYLQAKCSLFINMVCTWYNHRNRVLTLTLTQTPHWDIGCMNTHEYHR